MSEPAPVDDRQVLAGLDWPTPLLGCDVDMHTTLVGGDVALARYQVTTQGCPCGAAPRIRFVCEGCARRLVVPRFRSGMVVWPCPARPFMCQPFLEVRRWVVQVTGLRTPGVPP